MQIYNHDFTYRNSFTTIFRGSGLEGLHNITITDSLIYFQQNYYNSNYLIEVRNTVSPFTKIDSIIPPLIPPGLQPGPYNNYAIDANERGQVALVFTGLPYLFLFDKNNRPSLTLYLQSNYYEKLNNPSARPVKSKKAIRVDHYIRHILLTNSGFLLVQIRKKLYWIKPVEESYTLEKVIYPVKGQDTKKGLFGINFSDMVFANDTLYTCSIFEPNIYRFPLN